MDIKRFNFLRAIVCAGFLAGILLSHKLWFPLGREFPRAPLFSALAALSSDIVLTIEWLLGAALFVSLIVSVFARRKMLAVSLAATASVFILLVFLDHNRLQPWAYQYFLLLVVFVFYNARAEDESGRRGALFRVQLIIAALYFWSGLQKLNYNFHEQILPFLLAPVKNLLPPFDWPYFSIGIMIALVEMLVGVGLLFRRTRRLSASAAIAMHFTILILLIANRYNQIVWVWNLTLAALLFFGFWKSENSTKTALLGNFSDWKETTVKALIAAAVVVLPATSFGGFWDAYLSGALFSGNTEVAVVKIDEGTYKKLPVSARSAVFTLPNSGERILPLVEWALGDVNVPPYPEQRVSIYAARFVCRLADDKTKVELIVRERPAFFDGTANIRRISCLELETSAR